MNVNLEENTEKSLSVHTRKKQIKSPKRQVQVSDQAIKKLLNIKSPQKVAYI